MADKTYNGWKNYETWNVALWMDNDRGTHDRWLEVAVHCIASKADTLPQLANILKQEHEQSLPELTGFACDLLNAAMSEVDWYEIAEHLIADVKDTEQK